MLIGLRAARLCSQAVQTMRSIVGVQRGGRAPSAFPVQGVFAA